MVQYAGRVESRFTVPTGGASVSASLGSLSSPVTVTVPAGSYYYSAAGGVSSLITTLQSALNDSVQGYPQTAAAMQAAVGYGTWSAGWLMNDAASPLVGVFGGVNFTAAGTPAYRSAGPRGGIDYAINFNSTDDAFSAGNTFNALTASDLAIALVVKFGAETTGDILGKGYPGSSHLMVVETGAAFQSRWIVSDGVDTVSAQAPSATPTNTWIVMMGVLERATNRVRFGWRALDGSSSSTSGEQNAAAVGDVSNALNFLLGNQLYGAHPNMQIAGLYVANGAGAATGMSANLSTALTNFASAVNASWTVSQNQTDTGRVTISNSFWSCSVQFTDTSQRDVLGYAYDFDYPQTVAQASALGGGVYTTAYLFNEAAGNPASLFGTPATLTAVSSPTYSNLGPRGGTDKAIGFDSNLDALDGGDALDVAVTEDLCLAWYGKWGTTGSDRDVFGKISAALNGWRITYQTTSMRFFVGDGANAAACDAAGVPTTNDWYVAIAAWDRTAGTMRFGFQMLRSGVQTLGPSTSASAVGAIANAATFKVGSDAGVNANGTGHFVAALYVGVGVGYAASVPATLSTALSSFATYMKSQTSTQSARGIWFPDCPISLDGDPSQAPRVTDKRSSLSPTGLLLSLVGNSFRRHQGVMWTAVPKAQTWESAATYPNGSFETFANDCLYGLGHAWFTPSSPLQIYWNDSGTQRALGYLYNSSVGVPGWGVLNVNSTEPKRSFGEWTGYFRIELGDVVSVE
jgi:hypothetical protein